MKHNKQMPNEPMLEGKPASSWGWFLAGLAWLVLVAIVVVPAAFRNDSQIDKILIALDAAGVDRATAVLVMWVLALAPFMVALDRAVNIKHQYRKERGLITQEEQANHDRGNFYKVLLIVVMPLVIIAMIYLQAVGNK
jgi:uncharacterized membrane protein